MSDAERLREEHIRRLEAVVGRFENIAERLEKSSPELWKEFREEIEELLDEAREALDRVKSGRSDVEELKELMPFLDRMVSMVKDLIGTAISQLTSALDGRKLGEDIGSLYERLKQAGMPENLIAETVKEYTRKRLESSPSLPEVVEMLMNRFLSMNIRGIKGEQADKREKSSDKE
ncbi:MAG: hypothetical protein QXE01_00840 [Sulfolobales archaeon]